MTAMPIVETHRGVAIHDFQSRERIEHVVKPAIDAVFAVSSPAELFGYAGDKNNPPEARLLAAARYRALHEARATSHDARPGRLEQLAARVAGLASLEWAGIRHSGANGTNGWKD